MEDLPSEEGNGPARRDVLHHLVQATVAVLPTNTKTLSRKAKCSIWLKHLYKCFVYLMTFQPSKFFVIIDFNNCPIVARGTSV